MLFSGIYVFRESSGGEANMFFRKQQLVVFLYKDSSGSSSAWRGDS